METISSSIEPVVPRTANLLACRQWWRVCFLYGDQQKYYRQVYGKAAAQRLAATTKTAKTARTTKIIRDNNNKKNDNVKTKTKTIAAKTAATLSTATDTEISSTDRDYDIITDFIEAQLGELQDFQNDNNETSHVTLQQQPQQQQQQTVSLFPAKYQNSTCNNTASMTMRKSKKLLHSLKKHGHTKSSNKSQHKRKEKKLHDLIQHKTQITVLDDPFLFGIDEDHLGDLIRPQQHYATILNNHHVVVDDDKPALPPKKQTQTKPIDLNLNQQDLEFLNKSLQKRKRKQTTTATTAEIAENTENSADISFTFNEELTIETIDVDVDVDEDG